VLLKPEGHHPEIDDVTGDVDFICQSVDEAFAQVSRVGVTRDVVIAADRSHVVTNEIYQL
jgi:F-type H+-transporting ATPase subunit beta